MKKITLFLLLALPLLTIAQTIQNGTFDTDISNWVSVSSPTISHNSADGRTANGCLELVANATATNTGVRTNPNIFPSGGDGDYTYSVWIKGTADDQIRLDAFQNINGFKGGSTQTITSTGIWQEFKQVFDLLDGEGLNLRVIGRTAGATYLIDDVSFVAGNTLSISEFDINSVSLYPNPVKNLLNINNSTKINKVSIYEITGKLVIEELNLTEGNKVDVSRLNSGIYLLRVQDKNDNISTKRFIKK